MAQGSKGIHMFKVILFDLDNTLYSEKCGIFDLIDVRMNEWLTNRLNIPPGEVEEFRHRYFMQYGTTLRGLMLHHQVDPREFLQYVHDVPVVDFLEVDQELRKTLEAVRARKIVFTNSDLRHADRILDALGVRDLFDMIFDIEWMHYIPKPNPEPYRQALEHIQVSPRECLLIDDMSRNLKPARDLGMQTILIGTDSPSGDAERSISNLRELNSILEQIAASSGLSYNPSQ